MTSDRTEHRNRWDDEIAAYVLDALDERETALIEHHLAECPECRERAAWLAPAVDVVPASVPAVSPPPGLRKELMKIVEREAAEVAPAREPRRISLPVFGSFSLRPALVGFGIALLLVAGVAGYALRDGGGTETVSYAATPTGEGSIASGTLEVEGDHGTLTVSSLPQVEGDDVYQAWVQTDGQGGKIVPSSLFAVHDDGSGEVAISHGLDGAKRVMVTSEPKGGSEQPSGAPLLVAELE